VHVPVYPGCLNANQRTLPSEGLYCLLHRLPTPTRTVILTFVGSNSDPLNYREKRAFFYHAQDPLYRWYCGEDPQ